MDGERATKYLATETRNNILHGAAVEITDRYYELAADLVSVVSVQIPNFIEAIFGPLGFCLKSCLI